MIIYVDLLMDTGELVRIECANKHEDELHDSIANAMKRGDWGCPGQFDGCKAEYLGMRLDRVAMRRVIGIL